MTGILKKVRGHKSGVVYRSLVNSLYADVQVLLLGVMATCIAIWLTAFSTESSLLWVLGSIILLTGVGRWLNTRQFYEAIEKAPLDNASARRWEYRFTFGAAVHASVLGLWFISTCLIGDTFSQITSLAVLFGNMIGICCRSYPFARLVKLQTLAVLLSVLTGLFTLGGYYILLGVLLIPYMASVQKFATDLRNRLLHNIYQRREAEKTAEQFDTALDAVPQGICMFNANGAIEVANSNVHELTLGKTIVGLSGNQLVELLAANGRMSTEDSGVLMQWMTSPTSEGITHHLKILNPSSNQQKDIKFRASLMSNGGMIATFEDISREVEAASAIERMRQFDRLTGLLNRGQFEALLAQQLSTLHGTVGCALIIANLDRFKQINETLGHRFGDLLLCAATERLKEVSDEFGICARYGGDEFAVLVRSSECVDVSMSLADTIISVMQKPFDIEGRRVQLGCTIGIAHTNISAEDRTALAKQADFALEAAKNERRGEWRMFNEEMAQESQRRRELEADLRVALEQDQFEAFFQPLVTLKEKRVGTCEALIRWNHPREGYISPFHFIPIAEEMGLIADIGVWMLRESCKACASWPNDVRVAVNLSPIQFNEGNIVQEVQDALSDSGLEPHRLELEITESLMLNHIDDVIEKLNLFKQMGVRISLDDFGTGYSCLSYMNNLPLDKVKIDRSFVVNIKPNTKAMTLVQAITGLGHQLGLSVVIEGVENVDELSVLMANTDVDQIQGYLFSKPLPRPKVLQALQDSSPLQSEIVNRLSTAKKLAA